MAGRSSFVAALVILAAFSVPVVSSAQSVTVGLEQDFLPYAAGGYYGAAWVGKSHLRARALIAHVNKPSFIVPNGFTNNVVTAYALIGDYFLKDDFTGWYIGVGLVVWNSSIQSDLRQGTANYRNTLLNGTIGYNWKFYKNFYVGPWAGLHLRVGGARRVSVDGSTFATPLLTPEASVKIGWYFARHHAG